MPQMLCAIEADAPPDLDELTRLYNNFLRYKVFEIMRQMCAAALSERSFDFAFMMDADTAVNQSNLQRFVNTLGREASIYSGLCRRRSWGKPNGQRGVGGGPGIIFTKRVFLVRVFRSISLF